MSKKIRFVSGGTLGADGKPLLWEISKEPALSKAVYVFVPGVAVDVSDADAAWLMDPANTRGRVFEVVRGGALPASHRTPTTDAAASGTLNTSPAAGPELDAADKPRPGGPAGGR
jgi:hypothetical protein